MPDKMVEVILTEQEDMVLTLEDVYPYSDCEKIQVPESTAKHWREVRDAYDVVLAEMTAELAKASQKRLEESLKLKTNKGKK